MILRVDAAPLIVFSTFFLNSILLPLSIQMKIYIGNWMNVNNSHSLNLSNRQLFLILDWKKYIICNVILYIEI